MENLELVLYFQHANAIEKLKAAMADQSTYECIVVKGYYRENL